MAAAEAAAATARPELAARAAEALLADADAPRAHRVRARMAVIDLAGQALAAMDETFAAALADAGDDPALLAPLRLRLAWQAMVEGARERGALEAAEAIALADQADDTATAAMAGGVLAQMERVLGRPQYADTLKSALALPDPPITGWLHLTPRYVAARFAFFDDELDTARAELLRMLAVVEPGGGEELFEVLRSLAEVTSRAGRCREALDFAHRAEGWPRSAACPPALPGTRWPSPNWPAAACPVPWPTRGAGCAPRGGTTPSTSCATCTRWRRPGCAPATCAARRPRCAACATCRRRSGWATRRWCAGTTTSSPRSRRSARTRRPRPRWPQPARRPTGSAGARAPGPGSTGPPPCCSPSAASTTARSRCCATPRRASPSWDNPSSTGTACSSPPRWSAAAGGTRPPARSRSGRWARSPLWAPPRGSRRRPGPPRPTRRS
ncbi:hypothetical protein ACFQX7_30305 [Luedemannella flava]